MTKQTYTQEQIAGWKTDAILDSARTTAILQERKAKNATPEEVFDKIFDKQEDIELLGKIIKIVNLVKDVYTSLGMGEKFEEGLHLTILRGFGCAIRHEYDDPWFAEWDAYFQSWITIGDVIRAILKFEGFNMTEFLSSVKNSDQQWLSGYVSRTLYMGYIGLVGTRAELHNLRAKRSQYVGR